MVTLGKRRGLEEKFQPKDTNLAIGNIVEELNVREGDEEKQ